MSRITYIIIALNFTCAALAGASQALAQDETESIAQSKMHALYGAPHFNNVSNVSAPTPEAVKLVKSITDSVGIRANFKILAGDFSKSWGAFATIRNGQRYIVYDRKIFSWGHGKASWEDLWVMGHEIGHHVASHTLVDEYSQHEQELEADRFGGFALSKLGAPLEAALKIYSGDHPGSATHPGSARRRAAIKEGWLHGEAMKAKEGDGICKKAWASDELDVEGLVCRIAQTCPGRKTARLACQDYDGAWRWMN
jgi:hypothetical protein